MSLIDDFNESTEASLAPVPASFGDVYAAPNGYGTGFEGGGDNVRLETGYVSVSNGFGQADVPIFALNYVQFQLPAPLVDMAVSNNILVMALETFRILRIDLDHSLEVEEIEITRKASDGKISKVFFDPTGRHLIITTDHGENFYLYEKWRRTKQLSKLKGVTISSVAWNKQATLTDPSTREILIGTTNGLIYETCLEPTDESFEEKKSISSRSIPCMSQLCQSLDYTLNNFLSTIASISPWQPHLLASISLSVMLAHHPTVMDQDHRLVLVKVKIVVLLRKPCLKPCFPIMM